MIKKIHEITLRDIILLDATKSANSLKKYWIVPLWFYRKELEILAKQIFDLIGGSTIADLEDQYEKVLSYRKLQILEALYKAISVELNTKTRINAWKILLDKSRKESGNADKVIAEIFKYSGIEISEPKDLKTFSDYIQFKIDKHNEMFPEIQIENKEPANITKIIYSVFNFMSEPYNENMRLITFVELKAMAEDKIRTNNTENDGE